MEERLFQREEEQPQQLQARSLLRQLVHLYRIGSLALQHCSLALQHCSLAPHVLAAAG
jgi:hypothetical protein